MIRKIGTKNMAVILLIGAMVLAGNLAHAQTSMDPQWTELSPTGGLPSPRAGSAAVFDSATDQMFIFGGDRALPRIMMYGRSASEAIPSGPRFRHRGRRQRQGSSLRGCMTKRTRA